HLHCRPLGPRVGAKVGRACPLRRITSRCSRRMPDNPSPPSWFPHLMTAPTRFLISAEDADTTLAALLRRQVPGLTWSQARQHVLSRRIRINGELILDPARRVREGDTVELLGQSAPKP